MIKIPTLPYATNALEPTLTKEQVDVHFNKHHKTYVENLNKLIKGTKYEHQSLEEIVVADTSGPIYNNACQIWNHNLYWECMSPDKKDFKPESEVGKAIIKQFKSEEEFKKDFIKAGTKLFGSGWVALVKQKNELKIVSLKDAECPLNLDTATPLLIVDVWEHGYYITYRNDRTTYLDNFYKIINWDFIDEQYTK